MNIHLKIAFFSAPLLALLAYFLTGYWVDTAEESGGDNMQLRQVGQCRPAVGSCLFKRGGFELKLVSAVKQQQLQLAILSNRSLQSLAVALATTGGDFKQFPMMKGDASKYWQIKLEEADNLLDYQQLRMAMKLEDKSFFAESEVVFDGN